MKVCVACSGSCNAFSVVACKCSEGMCMQQALKEQASEWRHEAAYQLNFMLGLPVLALGQPVKHQWQGDVNMHYYQCHACC